MANHLSPPGVPNIPFGVAEFSLPDLRLLKAFPNAIWGKTFCFFFAPHLGKRILYYCLQGSSSERALGNAFKVFHRARADVELGLFDRASCFRSENGRRRKGRLVLRCFLRLDLPQ